MFLHAYHLRFPAPSGCKEGVVDITCPLPDDLRAYLGYVMPPKFQKYCFHRPEDEEIMHHNDVWEVSECDEFELPPLLCGNKDREHADMVADNFLLRTFISSNSVSKQQNLSSHRQILRLQVSKVACSDLPTPHILSVKRSGGGFGPFRSNPSARSNSAAEI